MGKKSGLIAVGLVLLATTGCVEAMNSGYPTTSYGYGYAPAYYNNGYYNNGYYNRGYSNSYYSQPGYYRPAPTVITQTRYVPVAVPAPRHHHHGWDKNGDGVPDRWQRRW